MRRVFRMTKIYISKDEAGRVLNPMISGKLI